ncbi:transposase [Streptomyces sp. NPDC001709]
MPGIGPLPGTEFLAAIGSDLADFTSPSALAAFAGLAPVRRTIPGSGTATCTRPRHYRRGLRDVLRSQAR